MEIKLKRGTVLIDDEDWDRLKSYKWYINKYTKAVVSPFAFLGDPSTVNMARKIMNPPKNLVIDHINGNRLDNRKKNLRIVSQQRNTWNRKAHKKSKYKGATKFSKTGKWLSEISIFRNCIHLGIYENAEEAAKAYDKAARFVYEETYVRPNFKQEFEIKIENMDILQILKKKALNIK